MAMNGAALGAAIATELKTLGIVIDDSSVDDVWDAVGEAVVAYIVANAQVVVASGSSAGTYSVI